MATHLYIKNHKKDQQSEDYNKLLPQEDALYSLN